MEFGWSEADETFRRELRELVEKVLAEGWAPAARKLGSKENVAFSRVFCAELARRGWLTPHWPLEHGGSGATAWQHIVMGEELWSVGEPRGPQYMNVNWIGPAIITHGTREQKELHLPPIARGDVIWCQGFSEPDAGSDLASLRTRAVRDGDEYVVNGSKIWTSYASVADWCFLLVRTDAEARPHHGISALLVAMGTPGLAVNTIPAIAGDHAFHELVFTDMRVRVASRLGPENGGWQVVTEALAYERVGAPRYAAAARVLDEAVEHALAEGAQISQSLSEKLGEARATCEAARVLAYRVIDERAAGLPPSPKAYLARAAMVQAERAVGAAVLELMGAEALVEGSPAGDQLRKSMIAGVAAGTYEMQLNLVARLILGLPKGA
jgi:alkylation response protein AidB-like acyl-CoA dehydrogenase